MKSTNCHLNFREDVESKGIHESGYLPILFIEVPSAGREEKDLILMPWPVMVRVFYF
jgi:hypothetical protein